MSKLVKLHCYGIEVDMDIFDPLSDFDESINEATDILFSIDGVFEVEGPMVNGMYNVLIEADCYKDADEAKESLEQGILEEISLLLENQ